MAGHRAAAARPRSRHRGDRADPRSQDRRSLPVAALRSEAFYVGALGSRKTHARRVERLKAAGFGDADIARIHAPIGLAIGAKSPAEIALAILAEVTKALRKPAVEAAP